MQLRIAPRVALVVALVVAVIVPAPAAGARSAEERRLHATKAKLAQVRADVEAAKGRQTQDAAALAEAERQLLTVMQAVAEAEQAVQRQRQAVERARTRLTQLQEAADTRQRVLVARAVSLYKQGSGVPFAAVLGADSAAQAMDRSAYAEVVARADRRTLEELEIGQVAVGAQQEYLAAEEATLVRVLEQQQEVFAAAEALRNERALAAAASSERVQRLQAQERHLEGESRELAALARRSARQAASRSVRGTAVAVRAAAGGWVWPARGPVTSEYGRRWGRMHEGIDIGAPTGSPVYAARAGTVSYVGRMGGYGNLTLIDHGEGIVTAYAHQSRLGVRPGKQVSAGEVIGAVGCTGSCTGPHLHFEVRVNGSSRNPRKYLG